MNKRALVLSYYYEPAFRGGGPIQTLKALLRAKPKEFAAAVVCTNSDLGVTEPIVETSDKWSSIGDLDIRYASTSVIKQAAALMSGYRRYRPSLVYMNSYFCENFSLLPQLLRVAGFGRGAVFLLAPRGELQPGALAIGARKKTLFIRAYRALGLHRTVVWHASSPAEAADIRNVFGKHVEVVVRENETSLPLEATIRAPRASGPCRIVFASRLSEKKGLHILLAALRDTTARLQLDIVGGFEDATYQRRCEALLAQLPATVDVTSHGTLPREDVLHLLRNADAMAFPTAGENFGHVIAEALSESCPVITTAETPWTTRLETGGVVVDDRTPEAWADAIEFFAARGPEDWGDASRFAGSTFNVWRQESKGSHVFDLALATRRGVAVSARRDLAAAAAAG